MGRCTRHRHWHLKAIFYTISIEMMNHYESDLIAVNITKYRWFNRCQNKINVCKSRKKHRPCDRLHKASVLIALHHRQLQKQHSSLGGNLMKTNISWLGLLITGKQAWNRKSNALMWPCFRFEVSRLKLTHEKTNACFQLVWQTLTASRHLVLTINIWHLSLNKWSKSATRQLFDERLKPSLTCL